MIDNIDIHTLLHSPNWHAQILSHFFYGFTHRDKAQGLKTELVYLVLPFVYDQNSRKLLLSAKSNSTFESTFINRKNGRIALSGVRDNIDEFFHYTNHGLIVLGNICELTISDLILIGGNAPTHFRKYVFEKKSFLRAAYYLGIIFSKSSYLDIFLQVGA